MASFKKGYSKKSEATEEIESSEVEVLPAEASEHSHADLEAKLVALEVKVSSLESKLTGLLESIEAASKIKSELEQVKSHLSAEIKELSSKASAQVVSSLDANGDGKIDFEEVYSYVHNRMKSRSPVPKK
jgi:chromosome segregation ATPase